MAKQKKRRTSGKSVPKPSKRRAARASPARRHRSASVASALLTDLDNLNDNQWHRLLKLEKQRRGVPDDRLVFVGCAHIAEYWWCAEQAVLKSREREIGFFQAYVNDRVCYALQLGKAAPRRRSLTGWLSIGAEITESDVEALLAREPVPASSQPAGHQGPAWAMCDGKVYVYPRASIADRQLAEEEAREAGLPVVLVESSPLLLGNVLEASHAERYPRLRWHWERDLYVVVGVPDGIAAEFVYEFKTTRNPYLARLQSPIAMAQADLYGTFWKRPEKRVQQYIREKQETLTTQVAVDTQNALNTLRSFRDIDSGRPPVAPVAWKCKNCEYANAGCRVNRSA